MAIRKESIGDSTQQHEFLPVESPLTTTSRRTHMEMISDIQPDHLSRPFDQAIYDDSTEELSTDNLADLPQNELQQLADDNGLEVADALIRYIREITKIPLLSHSEEIELAQTIESGTEDQTVVAKHKLTTSNLRLVIAYAKKRMGQGVPLLDLIQEGNIGLMRAVDKYDWRRGNRFSTYATWWIKQGINRAVSQQNRMIHLPEGIQRTIRTIDKETTLFLQEFGRKPTSEELADLTGIPLETIDELQKAPTEQHLSLDMPTDETDVNITTYAERVQDEAPTPAEEASQALLKVEVQQALNMLSQREQAVLQLRFGLGKYDGKTHNLKDAGKILGISRERVRQIEAEAIRKLRHSRRLQDVQ